MNNDKIEKYMVAILSNPKWFENVCARWGSGGVVSNVQLANAISTLEDELIAQDLARNPNLEDELEKITNKK